TPSVGTDRVIQEVARPRVDTGCGTGLRLGLGSPLRLARARFCRRTILPPRRMLVSLLAATFKKSRLQHHSLHALALQFSPRDLGCGLHHSTPLVPARLANSPRLFIQKSPLCSLRSLLFKIHLPQPKFENENRIKSK